LKEEEAYKIKQALRAQRIRELEEQKRLLQKEMEE
jgi:hypothetical protein